MAGEFYPCIGAEARRAAYRGDIAALRTLMDEHGDAMRGPQRHGGTVSVGDHAFVQAALWRQTHAVAYLHAAGFGRDYAVLVRAVNNVLTPVCTASTDTVVPVEDALIAVLHGVWRAGGWPPLRVEYAPDCTDVFHGLPRYSTDDGDCTATLWGWTALERMFQCGMVAPWPSMAGWVTSWLCPQDGLHRLANVQDELAAAWRIVHRTACNAGCSDDFVTTARAMLALAGVPEHVPEWPVIFDEVDAAHAAYTPPTIVLDSDDTDAEAEAEAKAAPVRKMVPWPQRVLADLYPGRRVPWYLEWVGATDKPAVFARARQTARTVSWVKRGAIIQLRAALRRREHEVETADD